MRIKKLRDKVRMLKVKLSKKKPNPKDKTMAIEIARLKEKLRKLHDKHKALKHKLKDTICLSEDKLEKLRHDLTF